MKRLIVQIIVAALFITPSFSPVSAQSVSPRKTVKVKIYLLDSFESENLLENMKMLAVEREVSAASPLRSALEAQLSGATEDEENTLRLYSPVGKINLVGLRVKNKTAYAYFTHAGGDEEFDRLAALRFRKAIRLTALQFPNVKRIEICLDGAADFWLVGAKTHKKCD